MLLALNNFMLLAQRGGDAAAAGAAMMFLLVQLAVSAVVLAIVIWAMITIFTTLDRLPPECRENQPWQAFLLLIPCFNIIWYFFILPGTSRSVERYFSTTGNNQGDCGAQQGLLTAVFLLICGPVGLIMLAMWCSKVSGLKKLIR